MARINKQEASRLYTVGCSLGELGEKYDCSHTTVARHLRAAGVSIRQKGWPAGRAKPFMNRNKNGRFSYG